LCTFAVALRKESVDRNIAAHVAVVPVKQSLSARRAWIEIVMPFFALSGAQVALRKESVDRNLDVIPAAGVRWQSLSARRAWIEIPAGCWRDARRACRSPQGERG